MQASTQEFIDNIQAAVTALNVELEKAKETDLIISFRGPHIYGISDDHLVSIEIFEKVA